MYIKYMHSILTNKHFVAIEHELANLKTLPKTELSNHFNNILQKINDLEKRLTKATTFIPSYDERQFSLVSYHCCFTRDDGH